MEPLDVYSYLMIAVFVVGYVFITIEEWSRVNKATVALLMAILCWVIQFHDPQQNHLQNSNALGEHLNSTSQIIFFLIGALTVVEIINVHQGFHVLSDAIQISSKKKLLWVVSIVTFFLSAILDNLTTTIVMVTLLQRLIDRSEDRLIIGSAVVIAANAGGAWTPIGDVTTTMLWISERVSTFSIMQSLFIPSVVCSVVSVLLLSRYLKGEFKMQDIHLDDSRADPLARWIFFLGAGLLIFVPVFKGITGLPPFMGMLLALSLMWIFTDILHSRYHDRDHLRVPYVLTRIDLSGTLFFLGILLCVDALESAGVLDHLAVWLDHHVNSISVIATLVGIASAVVDNVPLVAATMGMYDIVRYPVDHRFWEMIAYCAGTGGSMLIIGSAAGVVFMGLEKVSFVWYCKRVTIPAFLGYIAGIITYMIQTQLAP